MGSQGIVRPSSTGRKENICTAAVAARRDSIFGTALLCGRSGNTWSSRSVGDCACDDVLCVQDHDLRFSKTEEEEKEVNACRWVSARYPPFLSSFWTVESFKGSAYK